MEAQKGTIRINSCSWAWELLGIPRTLLHTALLRRALLLQVVLRSQACNAHRAPLQQGRRAARTTWFWVITLAISWSLPTINFIVGLTLKLWTGNNQSSVPESQTSPFSWVQTLVFLLQFTNIYIMESLYKAFILQCTSLATLGQKVLSVLQLIS